jgi:glycosyltransferase involved in cell wall biosynthesis
MNILRAERLRICIVAPPWYPLPPQGYGGAELVVHLLHNELRRLGHDVTVFGAEGSGPGVDALASAAWTKDLDHPHAYWFRLFTYLARVGRTLEERSFDVLHDNSGYPSILLWALTRPAPVLVHTMHEALQEPGVSFLKELRDRVRFVAISAAQAATVAELKVAAVVHNAVDLDSLRIGESSDGYLIEIGRIHPTKGQHLAIEVARRTGRRLVLAGKVQSQTYFDQEIKPHLGAQIEYRPNVTGHEKQELIARADAGIFPLQWEEPFGLAIAECMASGTPAVALARGSAAELIDQGITGFVAEDVDGLVEAVGSLGSVDRVSCGKLARERFSPERMARGYLRVYDR